MRSVQDPVTIDEINMTSHDFSEVHLFRRAALNMAVRRERTVLKMARLFGDRTGLLHSRANQTIYLEASNTEHSVSKPAVNLRVDKDAEMVFGASLYVIGDGAKGTGQIPGDSSFTLDGRMIDVTHLFVTKRLKSRFHSHAHSADIHNGTITVAAPGTFVLATFEIQDGSEVYFPDFRGMRCEAGLVHMKYGSVIVADTYRVSITSLLLETGSRITASGKDRPSSYDSSALPSSCRGSGGSYGSKGGKGTTVWLHNNPRPFIPGPHLTREHFEYFNYEFYLKYYYISTRSKYNGISFRETLVLRLWGVETKVQFYQQS